MVYRAQDRAFQVDAEIDERRFGRNCFGLRLRRPEPLYPNLLADCRVEPSVLAALAKELVAVTG